MPNVILNKAREARRKLLLKKQQWEPLQRKREENIKMREEARQQRDAQRAVQIKQDFVQKQQEIAQRISEDRAKRAAFLQEQRAQKQTAADKQKVLDLKRVPAVERAQSKLNEIAKAFIALQRKTIAERQQKLLLREEKIKAEKVFASDRRNKESELRHEKEQKWKMLEAKREENIRLREERRLQTTKEWIARIKKEQELKKTLEEERKKNFATSRKGEDDEPEPELVLTDDDFALMKKGDELFSAQSEKIPILCGELEKRNSKGVWCQKYVVVQGFLLYYSRTKDDFDRAVSPSASPIDQAKMSCVPLAVVKGIFKVPTTDMSQFVVECTHPQNSAYIFRAQGSEQREWWQTSLERRKRALETGSIEPLTAAS